MKSPIIKKSSNQKNIKPAKVQPVVGDKKQNTSLRLKKQTLKALKIRAIEQDTSIQKLIESLIEEYLSKSK